MPDASSSIHQELIDADRKYPWFTLLRDRNWKSRGRKTGGNKVAKLAIRRAALRR